MDTACDTYRGFRLLVKLYRQQVKSPLMFKHCSPNPAYVTSALCIWHLCSLTKDLTTSVLESKHLPIATTPWHFVASTETLEKNIAIT